MLPRKQAITSDSRSGTTITSLENGRDIWAKVAISDSKKLVLFCQNFITHIGVWHQTSLVFW